MRWFRFYDDVLDDPKVQRLPPHLFKSWVNLLCLASKEGGNLPSDDDIAFKLRMSVKDAAEQIQDLIIAGLIDVKPNGARVAHNWEVRQCPSDTSAERTRKYRKRLREKSCDVTGDVTATVQIREEKIREDKNSFSAHERVTDEPLPEPPRPVENKKMTGREFWTQAMRVEPEPEHRTVTCENGKLVLHNGYRREWLGRFDGDANRLDLALLQAMNFVQPNSGKPLEAQVSAQLARQVAEKCDRDTRYAAASKHAKPDRSNMVFKPSRYGPGKWVPKEAVAS